MRSQRPKVLHELAGQPLLWHILQAVRGLQPQKLIVVTGFGAELVETSLAADDIHWVRQNERNGTGHAVLCALPALQSLTGDLLILNGDHPLIQTSTLQTLLNHHQASHALLTLLSTSMANPEGYGRIVRDAHGSLLRIVEEKDADDTVRKIQEVNTGFYCVSLNRLADWLAKLNNHNTQKEYYLPDILPMAIAEGGASAIQITDTLTLSGINSRAQLAQLEAAFRDRIVTRFMEAGVTFIDPTSCWVAADAQIGQDTIIAPNVILGPETIIGERCHIGPFCHIQHSTIGPETHVHPFCHLEGAVIDGQNGIGPYARLRPGTQLGHHAKVGNFCELKKAQIGAGSKINHLSYIGDAVVGSGVNIGAGTITCNYDGSNKHRTTIEDNVFVGSDVQFIAPIHIGSGATIGAGTTVTKNVPAAALAISRTSQTHISNWLAKKNHSNN